MCEVTEVLRLKTPSLPPAAPGPPPEAVLLSGWGLFLRAIKLGAPRTPSPPPPPPPPYIPPCEEEEEDEEEDGPEIEGGAGGGGGSMARDCEEERDGRWWEKGTG